MSSLAQAIRSLIAISDQELDTFVGKCYRKSFPKKSLLSGSAKFIDEIYFIESGLIRVMISDPEGKEHSTHFAYENQFIADYNAFLTGQKSFYQLQALEETHTVVLTREAIEWGYEELQEGQKLGRLIAEYYFIYLDNRIQQLYSLSPKQRYDHLNHIFPNIHQRVPQHMIASYLGISPVHLSRLKRAEG